MSSDTETTMEVNPSNKVVDAFKGKIMSPEDALKPPMVQAPGVADIKAQIEAMMSDAERKEFQRFAASEANAQKSHAPNIDIRKEQILSQMNPKEREEFERSNNDIKKIMAEALKEVAPEGASVPQSIDPEMYEEVVQAAAQDPKMKYKESFGKKFKKVIVAVLRIISLGAFFR